MEKLKDKTVENKEIQAKVFVDTFAGLVEDAPELSDVFADM